MPFLTTCRISSAQTAIVILYNVHYIDTCIYTNQILKHYELYNS